MERKKNIPFYLFVFTLVMFLVLPKMVKQGLFFDGLIYASVSRNMAEGTGTAWSPVFSTSDPAPFYEHPPLAFMMQSLLFKICGDHFMTEKIYGLLMLCLSSMVMMLIWKKTAGITGINKEHAWLPVLLWILVPSVSWAFQNNMLENTLSFFSLLAVYVLLAGIEARGIKLLFTWVLASVCIFAGFLSKGFPALFPLAFYIFYYPVIRKGYYKNACLYTLFFCIIFLVMAMGFFMLHEPARSYMENYFRVQVMQSIQGERITGRRTYILEKLFLDTFCIWGITLAAGIFYYIATRKKIWNKELNTRPFYFYVLLGLSAAAPIMISPKQHGFYIVPAVPYIALGFSILLSPFMSYWQSKINFKAISAGCLLLIPGILILSVYNNGKFERDRDIIENVITLKKYMLPAVDINVSAALGDDELLKAYAQRYAHINFIYGKNDRTFFLSRAEEPVVTGYEDTGAVLHGLKLYRKAGK